MERVRKMLRSPINILLACISVLVMVVTVLVIIALIMSLLGSLTLNTRAALSKALGFYPSAWYTFAQILLLAEMVLGFVMNLGIAGTVFSMKAKLARLAASTFRVFAIVAIVSAALSILSSLLSIFTGRSGSIVSALFSMMITIVSTAMQVQYLSGWKRVFTATSQEIDRKELDEYPQSVSIKPYVIFIAIILGIAAVATAIIGKEISQDLGIASFVLPLVFLLMMLYYILTLIAYNRYCKAHFSKEEHEPANQ